VCNTSNLNSHTRFTTDPYLAHILIEQNVKWTVLSSPLTRIKLSYVARDTTCVDRQSMKNHMRSVHTSISHGILIIENIMSIGCVHWALFELIWYRHQLCKLVGSYRYILVAEVRSRWNTRNIDIVIHGNVYFISYPRILFDFLYTLWIFFKLRNNLYIVWYTRYFTIFCFIFYILWYAYIIDLCLYMLWIAQQAP